MDAPLRFGQSDVSWAPSVNHDPKQVVATWLQHRVILAVRTGAGSMSVREMAARAGVHKSTMGRWLTGQEVLDLSGLGVLAGAFGLNILEAVSIDGDDRIGLLPEPYRPLAQLRDGQLIFRRPEEPAWHQLVAATAAALVDAETDGSAHLVTASTLAWVLARKAHGLAPTQDLVDLDPERPGIVTLGLEQPVKLTVTLVPQSTAAHARRCILDALSPTDAERDAGARSVSVLVFGQRGARIFAQIVDLGVDGHATIPATTLARAGIGDPIDADVTVVDLARADAGSGAVVLLEIVKTRAG